MDRLNGRGLASAATKDRLRRGLRRLGSLGVDPKAADALTARVSPGDQEDVLVLGPVVPLAAAALLAIAFWLWRRRHSAEAAVQP
ncbi:MAG: hypothetical protein ACREOL_04550 [Candidatus Dormibacteria bacterium]